MLALEDVKTLNAVSSRFGICLLHFHTQFSHNFLCDKLSRVVRFISFCVPCRRKFTLSVELKKSTDNFYVIAHRVWSLLRRQYRLLCTRVHVRSKEAQPKTNERENRRGREREREKTLNISNVRARAVRVTHFQTHKNKKLSKRELKIGCVRIASHTRSRFRMKSFWIRIQIYIVVLRATLSSSEANEPATNCCFISWEFYEPQWFTSSCVGLFVCVNVLLYVMHEYSQHNSHNNNIINNWTNDELARQQIPHTFYNFYFGSVCGSTANTHSTHTQHKFNEYLHGVLSNDVDAILSLILSCEKEIRKKKTATKIVKLENATKLRFATTSTTSDNSHLI